MPDKLSVLDLYTKRVYKIVVMIIPIFCLCASATITTLHFLGFYPDINETAMWLFCASDIIYFALGIFFMKTGFDEDGVVRKNRLVQAKYVTATVIIIQWNAISYIWPFTDFWAFGLLFVIVFAFFFDVKLVLYETVGITVSMFISWFLNGTHLLPADDELFAANMTFRLVGYFLMLLSVNIITFFGGKFLVKEIEKRIYYDKVTETEVEMLTRQMKEFSPAENASYESANIVDLEIKSRDEIKDIYSGIRSMQINIVDHLNHLSEMKREKEAKEAELGVATKIQADMLPKDFPEREDIELYAAMTPAKEVGGDFYDFFFIDDDHIALVMADVAGKGVPAALFCVVAKAVIRDKVMLSSDPVEILRDVNHILCANNSAGLFITVWLGILDLKTGVVEYVNAGHEYPIIGVHGNDVEVIQGDNCPPLAAMEDTEFTKETLILHNGDNLFLYTDGVPEAKSANGERFGMDRLIDVLKRNRGLTTKQIVTDVKWEVDSFQPKGDPFDDVTIMSVIWKGSK